MNPAKIYVEVPGELGWREYNINELVSLWRAARLPRNATYQNDAGEWRPVAELVDPIIERESRAKPAGSGGNPAPILGRLSRRVRMRWVWVAAGIIILAGALCLRAFLQARHSTRRVAPKAVEEALDSPREALLEEVIKSGQVIPGMTVEQVRRSWGEPKSKKATADSTRQQWVYRRQTVIFKNGVVTRLEDNSR